MDSKVRRLAILTMISAMALVLTIVYAVNARKIHKIASDGDTAATAATAQEGSTIVHGEQIGENLKGFLTDDNFFDAPETVEQIREESVQAVELSAEPGPGSITARVMNLRGGLETGVNFTLMVNGKPYRDNEADGMFRIENLEVGRYRLHLKEQEGYHVPTSDVVIDIREGAPRTEIADSPMDLPSASSSASTGASVDTYSIGSTASSASSAADASIPSAAYADTSENPARDIQPVFKSLDEIVKEAASQEAKTARPATTKPDSAAASTAITVAPREPSSNAR